MHPKRKQWDVLVIGGGPAGAIAAQTCALEGLSVLLLEKERFDREKPCGGGLTPKVIVEFAIPDRILERKITRVRFITESGQVLELPLPDGRYGATVRRGQFDRYLVQRAKDAGAVTRQEHRVLMIKKQCKKGYEVRISDVQKRLSVYSVSFIIACDGAHSRVRRDLGYDRRAMDRIAVQYTYYLELPVSVIDKRIGDAFELYIGGGLSTSSYAWLFPKREHVTVGVGSLVAEVRARGISPRTTLEQIVATHPSLREKLAGGKLFHSAPSMIAYPGCCARTYSDRVLLAGDAAGHANMFTGEGIYYAMKAGRLAGQWAVRAIENGKTDAEFLAGYEHACQKAFGAELDAGVERRLRQGGMRTIETVFQAHGSSCPNSEADITQKRQQLLQALGW